MELATFCACMGRIAPRELALDFDNVGLLVEPDHAEIKKVLLALDCTAVTAQEAIDLGVDLLVTHHPQFFHGVKSIGFSSPITGAAALLLRHGIGHFAAHTNLDNARGGVNFEIANRLGLQGVRFLKPAPDDQSGSGIVGELAEPENAEAFLRRVKDIFHVESLQHNSLLERPVKTVAVCGGAGDFLLGEALRQKADAFLTGEMHYHVFFGHEQEIQIGVMGHYQSEQFTIELLGDVLKNAFPELRLVKTKMKTNPISYM